MSSKWLLVSHVIPCSTLCAALRLSAAQSRSCSLAAFPESGAVEAAEQQQQCQAQNCFLQCAIGAYWGWSRLRPSCACSPPSTAPTTRVRGRRWSWRAGGRRWESWSWLGPLAVCWDRVTSVSIVNATLTHKLPQWIKVFIYTSHAQWFWSQINNCFLRPGFFYVCLGFRCAWVTRGWVDGCMVGLPGI